MQSATLPTLLRGRARIITLAALLLGTLSVVLAVITVSAQSGGNGPVTHIGVGEPETVGPVTNLTATAADGEVRLTWTPAQNAQAHFVVYLPAADANAGNYADTQMVAVSGGSDTVIAGLPNGTAYIFNAIGMRWNWVNYGAVWGSWDSWVNATPAAAPTATPAPADTPTLTSTPTLAPPAPGGGVVIDTPTATPTVTPAPAPTATPAPTPTATPVPAPTATATPTPTATPAPAPTPTAAPTPTPTATRDTGSVAGDRAALVALYKATDGANWKSNGKWLSDAPLGKWRGVTTDRSGRVTGLRLGDNRLTGVIPAELGNLSNLEELYLSHNRLTGAIPAELGNLSNLAVLELLNNRLTGAIPAELGNLSSLQHLNLNRSGLTGAIPAELGNLSNLQQLYIGHNPSLTGKIPAELGSLSNLTHLWLHDNQLTGAIPAELGSLANLTHLGIHDNQLTGAIPAELGNLSNLRRLVLHENRLTGAIPAELGNLSNLERLALSGSNRLTGCIPAGLLDVQDNDLGRLGLPKCS